MIELFTTECTYRDIAERTGRSRARVMEVAKGFGLECVTRLTGEHSRHCRIFSPEQANEIVGFFNRCNEAKRRRAKRGALLTVREIAARFGMKERRVLFLIAKHAIAPEKTTYIADCGTRTYYTEAQAEQIARLDKKPNSDAPKPSKTECGMAGEWATVRWFASKLHADCADVCKAINALELPVTNLPGGTLGKPVQHYQVKHLNAIRAWIQAKREHAVTVIRRTSREDDD